MFPFFGSQSFIKVFLGIMGRVFPMALIEVVGLIFHVQSRLYGLKLGGGDFCFRVELLGGPDEYGAYDGVPDLTLKFKTREVAAALGDVGDGDVLVLVLEGYLQDEFGGGAILGEDVVIILKKDKK